MRFDVFLGFDGHHRRFARYLYSQLKREQKDLHVFMDEVEVNYGDNLLSSIAAAVKEASILIFIAGPNKEHSYLKEELDRFLANNKSTEGVIGVRLSFPPSEAAGKRWTDSFCDIDIRGLPKNAKAQKIIKCVNEKRELINWDAPRTPSPEEDSSPEKYNADDVCILASAEDRHQFASILRNRLKKQHKIHVKRMGPQLEPCNTYNRRQLLIAVIDRSCETSNTFKENLQKWVEKIPSGGVGVPKTVLLCTIWMGGPSWYNGILRHCKQWLGYKIPPSRGSSLETMKFPPDVVRSRASHVASDLSEIIDRNM